MAVTLKKEKRKRKTNAKKKRRQVSAVHRAGELLKIAKVGDNRTMGVNDAMRFAGFNTTERQDRAYQKQVTRHRDRLEQRLLLPSLAQAAQEPHQINQTATTTSKTVVVQAPMVRFQTKKNPINECTGYGTKKGQGRQEEAP